MRPRGGIVAGTLPNWTSTATSGVFTLREAQVMKSAGTWMKSGDVYWQNVSLLLLMDGDNNSQAFTDLSSHAHTVTAVGDAKISTTQSKFGGSSLYLDGNGDSLTVASSASVSGTGDFTIEFWARPTAFGTAYCVWLANDTSYGFATSINNNGTVSFGRSLVSSDGTTSNAVDFGQWNHVALCRSSGTLRIYINGVKGYDAAVSTSFASGTIRIGTDGGGSALPYSGYIDDLRITTVARYTGSTIAVPTAAFPTS